MNEQLELGGLGARQTEQRFARPVSVPPARVEFDSRGDLAIPAKRITVAERERWQTFIVGGWPDYSQWIDPRTVPLCRDHNHPAPSAELAQVLVRICVAPSLLVRRCFTAAWREYPAGAICLTYGSIDGAKFDLFMLVA